MDGLTQATVLPCLQELQKLSFINSILFITIEREGHKLALEDNMLPDSVEHVPIYSKNYSISILNKIFDFILFPKLLVHLSRQYKITLIIAHGAPAGALAYKVWKQTKIPFYVSLFEPHAAYMLESGVWSRSGLKYRFQSYWEKKQKQYATGLLPVSEQYRQLLEKEGVPPEKLRTIACTTNLDHFQFLASHRYAFREKLEWQQEVIGVYVGKFGGLYYQNEAFAIYKICFEIIPGFRLLILSPQDHVEINKDLLRHQLDVRKVKVMSVQHNEVAAYLSAADFAFATYKPGPSKKYLSPVKIGEYWASGLPVLLTEGVGDDSDIIKNEGGGALFNLKEEGSVEKAILKIQEIIKQPGHREQIRGLAIKYRSPDQIREAYEYFLGEKLNG
ncbi:glycosyltransferase [Pontibacter qinzhouensis]|nr:glycosyltransferase [Pontibacter qinzhouensis]